MDIHPAFHMLQGDDRYSAYDLRIYPLPQGRELLVGVFKDTHDLGRRPDRAFRITLPAGFQDWVELNQYTQEALQSGDSPINIDLG